MRNRVFVLILAFAAVLVQPEHLDAAPLGFDPTQPIYSGYLVEDSTCPASTHALLDVCTRQRQVYLVFNHMKAVKRYEKGIPLLQGPADTTSCSQPLIDVRRIAVPKSNIPPPCGP